jgi:hypothetical protein
MMVDSIILRLSGVLICRCRSCGAGRNARLTRALHDRFCVPGDGALFEIEHRCLSAVAPSAMSGFLPVWEDKDYFGKVWIRTSRRYPGAPRVGRGYNK